MTGMTLKRMDFRRPEGSSAASDPMPEGFEVFVTKQDGWGEPMTPMPFPFDKEA